MDQVEQQLAFHRLARSHPRHRWWRPLVTGLLGVAFYLVFTIVLLLVAILIALATSADVQQYFDPESAIDLSDPVIFAFTLASLIIMIPALVLATLIMGAKPLGLLSSVVGRLRWRWLGVCTLVSIGIYAVSLVISALLTELLPSESIPLEQPDSSTMVILLTMTLLAVPFQAAAEEYVFRGYLMQLVGSWLKHPAFAILLPVPLFTLAHLYDPFGQASVAIFALFAGWITWRTGGLEAAIAVHAINNMSIFALGAFGLADVNATEGSVSGLVVSILTTAVTAFVIVKLADRRGIERTRPVAAVAEASPGWPGSTAFPAGDGVWHEGPSPQVSAAGQFGGWSAPGQRETAQGGTRHYDAGQYEPAHYSAPSSEQGAGDAPSRAGASAASARGSSPLRLPDHTPTPPREASTVPVRPDTPTGPGYPSGTAYPTGPGYPSGQGFPSGPGYPSERQRAAPTATQADTDRAL